MGEDPRTVHVVGAPGLDNLHRPDLAGQDELESFLGLRLEPPVVQVTLHPATYGGDPIVEASAIATAMDEVQATYVVTLPNADPGEAEIRAILEVAAEGPRRTATAALGERRFWGLMRLASAMLGNSSSAIIEAPALRLPAVNVGIRQQGRIRGANVIDVPAEATAIAEALRLVLAPGFRQALPAADSPYGDGRAAGRIVTVLAGWTPPRPPFKVSWSGGRA
jgi:UDP-hydrolysing UDP-N-acetyl-D-glucosamine 2-epimerase